MSWKSFNANELVPSEISETASAGASLLDQYVTVTKALMALAKTYQSRLGGGADPLAVAVKALVDVLEGALQVGKVHTLFIPMTKIYPDGTGTLGGNARFYGVFANALNDDFDPNRPQYTEDNDAVVMSVLMAGAPSYTEAVEIANTFNRMFRPPSNNDMAANTIPTPQNVKARPVAHPSSKRVAVRLDWDAPKSLFTFPFFPGVGSSVKRYAVIRSTSASILNARSVLDLFSTRALKTGMTSSDAAKKHKVLGVGTGTNSTFVDKDDDLDPSLDYYYAVAWEVAVVERGAETIIPFDRLSNIAKTRVRTVAATENAIPPNWNALPSLMQLVPSLADSTFLLAQQLRALMGRSGGSKNGLSKALGLVEARLARLVQDIDDINTSFKQLSVVLGQPIPTLHATTFYGTGGNEFLQAQLSAALNDTGDINRPPFDDNEYVMGLCIVAGGPRIPDIQPIIDFLTALFGGGEAENPLSGILDVLDGAVAEVEEVVFGENMEPLPVNPDGTVQLPDGTSVDPSSIDPDTGTSFPDDTPVVGTDGTMLATDDPANPQAGETNVTPLSDLC